MLFIYLAPFFVVIGARWLFPGDRFGLMQWLGLLMAFVGMVVAFGVPAPATEPHQLLGDLMMAVAALAWAATTLIIKSSALARVSPEKTLLYQTRGLRPDRGARRARCSASGSRPCRRRVALGSLAYQTIVVGTTFSLWFALIVKFSASRLSAFTFLTPLFGVAAGHLVLGEPLTPAFAWPWCWWRPG